MEHVPPPPAPSYSLDMDPTLVHGRKWEFLRDIEHPPSPCKGMTQHATKITNPDGSLGWKWTYYPNKDLCEKYMQSLRSTIALDGATFGTVNVGGCVEKSCNASDGCTVSYEVRRGSQCVGNVTAHFSMDSEISALMQTRIAKVRKFRVCVENAVSGKCISLEMQCDHESMREKFAAVFSNLFSC